MDVKVDDGRRQAVKNGMYFVCMGLSLEIVSLIAEGIITDDTIFIGRVVRIISIAAFGGQFWGFLKLSGVSIYYRRAKEMTLAAIILLSGMLLFDVLTLKNAGVEEILTGSAYASTIVVILVVSILEIFINKYLLYGNAEITREEGDDALAEKFMRLWRNFIVATVMLIIVSIAMLGAILALAYGYFAQMNDVLLTGGIVWVLSGESLIAFSLIYIASYIRIIINTGRLYSKFS